MRGGAWVRPALTGLLAALLIHDASAVITLLPTGSPRRITMQVGSADTAVNQVVFDVSNANVSPNPLPITGVPGAGAPATTPAGGVLVRVITRNGNNTELRLTVDSSAGLSCVPASGCGATVIPFSTISWVAYNHDTTYPTFDIQNGVFTGAVAQLLTDYIMVNVSVDMSNVLIFSYDNATLYPAGQYLGRVTYTATMP